MTDNMTGTENININKNVTIIYIKDADLINPKICF